MNKIKCPECKGDGNVQVSSYRDNATPPQEPKPKKERTMKLLKSIGSWFKTYWSTLAVVGIGIGGLVFLGWAAVSCDKAESKHGWITVQYGPDNKTPIRCWIFPVRGSNIEVSGPASKAFVNDRHHASNEAKALGVDDVKQCILMNDE